MILKHILVLLYFILLCASHNDKIHYYITRPDVFLIGAQKCGTTSLHKQLIEHDDICRVYPKEFHYFDSDKHYNNGSIYIDNIVNKYYDTNRCNSNQLTIDATPKYIRTDYVPLRMINTFKTDMNKKKFILLLRNPVESYISWYKNQMRFCIGNMLDVINNNSTREVKVNNKIKTVYSSEDLCRDFNNKGELTYCRYLGCYRNIPYNRNENVTVDYLLSYLYTLEEYFQSRYGQDNIETGYYYKQILTWLNYINRNQLIIFHINTLINDNTDSMTAIAKFLGLSKNNFGNTKSFPHANESPVPVTLSCDVIKHLDKLYGKVNYGLIEYINSNKSQYELPFPADSMITDMSYCNNY